MKVAALIKFGREDHMRDLLANGVIYMNTLPYFWSIEDGGLRGDPNDSAIERQRGKTGNLVVKSSGQKIEVKDWDIRVHPDNPERINLFCMYAFRPKNKEIFHIDERNFEFGSHAVVFHESQAFLDCLKAAITAENLNAQANLVEYVPNKHCGTLGPFKKLDKYNYQSEWRLVATEGNGKERKIRLGSLTKFASLLESKSINEAITYCS